MTTYKVRVCPVCRKDNPATVSDCQYCAADILSEPLETRYGDPAAPASAAEDAHVEDDDPDTNKVRPPAPTLVLEAMQRPDMKFNVAEGQSVGRTGEADVVLKGVPNLDYISRKMVIFTRRGDQWFVQHLGNTNYITVDGERYETDENIAVHNGSILGLALSQFMIRIPEGSAADNG